METENPIFEMDEDLERIAIVQYAQEQMIQKKRIIRQKMQEAKKHNEVIIAIRTVYPNNKSYNQSNLNR